MTDHPRSDDPPQEGDPARHVGADGAPGAAGGVERASDPEPVVQVSRPVRIPDRLRLARYRHGPEYGPRLLFFSGGTALNALSRALLEYTHNSIHLITPFDSGGSSAKLRGPFGVMGVGDFRSRLLALADQSVKGQAEVFELLHHRLPKDQTQPELHATLAAMIDGRDERAASVPEPLRRLICNHLRFFQERMPKDFDLRGASIGNLVLVGGFVNQAEDIESVIFLFSRLVEVRGVVRPVVDANLHLAAELEDGSTVVGQHLLTGKEVPPIASPIRRLYLVDSLQDPQTVRLQAAGWMQRLIERADLICYPIGSFYTSVVANFLPDGVGASVRRNLNPKVYVPNTGSDPEQRGMTLVDQVHVLVRYLRESGAADAEPAELIQFVVVDGSSPPAKEPGARETLEQLGIQWIEFPLGWTEDNPYLDEQRLISVLLSLP
jgi:CofD-related protein of GAK system